MGEDKDPKRYRRATLPIESQISECIKLQKTSQEVDEKLTLRSWPHNHRFPWHWDCRT